MQDKHLNFNSFYDGTAISSFNNKSVMYIGYIGTIKNESTFKYGLSRKIFKRVHEQHSKSFSRFDLLFVGETDNCENVESLFEKDLKVFHLYRRHTINNKTFTELFTISNKYSIDYLINLVLRIVLPALSQAG